MTCCYTKCLLLLLQSSDLLGSPLARSLEDGLPRVLEINSSAASLEHTSQRSEAPAADSTSKRKGRSHRGESDASAADSDRVSAPAAVAGPSSSQNRWRKPSSDSDSSSDEDNAQRFQGINSEF